MYRAIDLFAGIGGIRKGFDRAFGKEIETVYVNEWDEKAQETYRANFTSPINADSKEISISGDITKVDEKSIPTHDFLLAGFPCQAFSLAGERRGFDDTRGTLFFDVARIAKHHKPGVIFCENVKNLETHDKGKTFQVIKNSLKEMGYTPFCKVLNSKDFGVPQNRERIYIVAFRNDIAPAKFTFPIGADSTKTIQDILEKKEVSARYYLSDRYLTTLKKHRARHEKAGNGFGYVIKEYDDIASTLVTGGMGRERNLLVDDRLTDFTPETNIKGPINDSLVRVMTPREWARLQGYSEDFKLPVANTHLYRQLGNTVTVNVIEAIANKIKEVFDSAKGK